MRVFIVASVGLLVASCTGTLDSGVHSVRNVKEAKLQGQTIGTVLEILGTPDAYYAVPGGREQILTYDTTQQHYPEPNAIGCVLGIESPRVFRRLFCVSHAASDDSSSC
jgi:hypothetical protein